MATVDINDVINTLNQLIALNGSSVVKVDRKANPNDFSDMSWLASVEQEMFEKEILDGIWEFSPTKTHYKYPQWSGVLDFFPRTALDLTSDGESRFRGKLGDWIITGSQHGRGLKQHVVLSANNKNVIDIEFTFRWVAARRGGNEYVPFTTGYTRYAPLDEVKKHIRALFMNLKLRA